VINRNLLKVCVSFSCHILWLTSSTWLKANSCSYNSSNSNNSCWWNAHAWQRLSNHRTSSQSAYIEIRSISLFIYKLFYVAASKECAHFSLSANASNSNSNSESNMSNISSSSSSSSNLLIVACVRDALRYTNRPQTYKQTQLPTWTVDAFPRPCLIAYLLFIKQRFPRGRHTAHNCNSSNNCGATHSLLRIAYICIN